jgi:hypothetical protein
MCELTKDKAIATCQMIIDDMASDAREFDGKPFDGRTVAAYFGNQGAAIAALANIVKQHLEGEGVKFVPFSASDRPDDPFSGTVLKPLLK